MKTQLLSLLIGVLLPLTAAACGDATTEPVPATAVNAAAFAAAPAGGGPEYRSHSHGDHASALSYDPATGTFTFASVWRDGRGGRDLASLFYSIDRCYETAEGWLTCEWVAAGWGLIPANHLNGSGQSRLTLRTDTRELPEFEVWAGERGPVEIMWEKTEDYSSRNSGSWENRWFSLVTRGAGTSTFTSATFAGRIGDVPIASEATFYPSGSMGMSNNVSLHFSRGGN